MSEDSAGRLYPFRSARRRWRAAGKCLSGFIKQGVCQVLGWVPWRVRFAYPPYTGDMVKSGGLLRLKKIGLAVSPQAGAHRRDPVRGHDNTAFVGRVSAAHPPSGFRGQAEGKYTMPVNTFRSP